MTKKLRDVMNTELVALEEDQSASTAARYMRDTGVGSVLVTSRGRLSGILTDRDIVVRCVAGDFDPSQVPVGALCTSDVVALTPEAEDRDAVRVMVDRAVRRLPIVEDDHIVGMVSLGDLAVARDASSALGQISAAPPTGLS